MLTFVKDVIVVILFLLKILWQSANYCFLYVALEPVCKISCCD